MALVLVTAVASGGKPPKVDSKALERCAQSFEQGQERRQQEALIEARKLFEECAQAHCPAVLKASCGRWEGELQREIPVLRVRVERGPEAVVVLDGAPVGSTPLELPVNPGSHLVLARTAEGDGPARRVKLAPGGKEEISLAPAQPPAPAASSVALSPPAPPAERSRPVAPLVLLGVGGAALGVGAWLGVSTWSKARQLRGDCAPGCDASEVEGLRGRLRGADVLMGLGAVAGGVGLYLLLRKDTQVQVSPQAGGAAVSTTVTF
jgi:hypothetical protein